MVSIGVKVFALMCQIHGNILSPIHHTLVHHIFIHGSEQKKPGATKTATGPRSTVHPATVNVNMYSTQIKPESNI